MLDYNTRNKAEILRVLIEEGLVDENCTEIAGAFGRIDERAYNAAFPG